MLVTGSLAISAVLFDLDETLLDRTTSLRAFLLDQYARFSQRLGLEALPPCPGATINTLSQVLDLVRATA